MPSTTSPGAVNEEDIAIKSRIVEIHGVDAQTHELVIRVHRQRSATADTVDFHPTRLRKRATAARSSSSFCNTSIVSLSAWAFAANTFCLSVGMSSPATISSYTVSVGPTRSPRQHDLKLLVALIADLLTQPHDRGLAGLRLIRKLGDREVN